MTNILFIILLKSNLYVTLTNVKIRTQLISTLILNVKSDAARFKINLLYATFRLWIKINIDILFTSLYSV